MSLISITYIFSAGQTIIASQHNANNAVIVTAINGNLDNTNLSTSAGILYSQISLGGNITNSDINAAAAISNSKLNLSNISGNINIGSGVQGRIFYDNGTTITGLSPGISGQFLQTQGASANPQWANATLSNCLFQYAAITSAIITLASGSGEIIGSSVTPTTGGTWRFLQARQGQNSYTQVWNTRWKKISSLSTVTVYCEIWNSSASDSCTLQVDIGGQNNTVTGTTGQVTPEWKNFTIDVSSLTNGTVYAVSINIQHTLVNATSSVYLGNLIAFGS